MKKIEITSEWILDHFSDSVTVDGNGEVFLSTETLEAAYWIELALDTIEVDYKVSEFEPLEDEPQCMIWTEYTFRLSDIKKECPNTYESWYEIYLSNLYRNRKN